MTTIQKIMKKNGVIPPRRHPGLSAYFKAYSAMWGGALWEGATWAMDDGPDKVRFWRKRDGRLEHAAGISTWVFALKSYEEFYLTPWKRWSGILPEEASYLL